MQGEVLQVLEMGALINPQKSGFLNLKALINCGSCVKGGAYFMKHFQSINKQLFDMLCSELICKQILFLIGK